MKKNRFIRTAQLIGKSELFKIRQAKVAIFGIGAVGGYALEALARSGINSFTLTDPDTIQWSNFNRQIIALESNVDKYKVDVAKERVLEINPDCEVSVYKEFAHSNNLTQILSNNKPDIIIDAIDSVSPKAELIACAVQENIPIISSMGAAGKLDPFSIRVGDISDTSVCRLAKFIRRKLLKKGIVEGVRCVFSIQNKINGISSEGFDEGEFFIQGRKRIPLGSISYMTGLFGFTIAYEAISFLLNGHFSTSSDEQGKKIG